MKKPTYKAIDAASKVLRSLNLEEIIKIEELRELSEEARGDYDERSEKWQESEKGYDFQEKTDEIENFTVIDTNYGRCKLELDLNLRVFRICANGD